MEVWVPPKVVFTFKKCTVKLHALAAEATLAFVTMCNATQIGIYIYWYFVIQGTQGSCSLCCCNMLFCSTFCKCKWTLSLNLPFPSMGQHQSFKILFCQQLDNQFKKWCPNNICAMSFGQLATLVTCLFVNSLFC